MRKDESENSWLEYISQYPELFEKIKWDCRRYGMNWERFTGVLCKYKHEVS